MYEPDKRSMLKVKHERDCDCVVAGFRWHKNGEGTLVGSLLLGLFDAEGALQHVGVCASFTQAKRTGAGGVSGALSRGCVGGVIRGRGGRRLGEGSGCRAGRAGGVRGRICRGSRCGRSWWWRWRMSICRGRRFRHMAHFRRWREDKRPEDCTYAQLEVVAPEELRAVFAGGQ